MDDKEKFIVRISCEPKITPTDIGAKFVDKMLTLRVEKVNESVISQLRELMKEKGINELIAIDESKVLEMVKKAQALDIFKEHELADTLFSYLKVDKTPDNWNWGLPKKMQVNQEKWDLLREVIYGKETS